MPLLRKPFSGLAALCLLVFLVECALAASFPSQPMQPSGDSNSTQESAQKDETWKDGFEIALGFLTAVFTGIIATYAVFQYGEMRRSGERQLRAYVMIDEGEASESYGQWNVRLKIRNFGRTPAYDLKVKTDIRFSPLSTGLASALDFPDRGFFLHPSSVIGPGHPFNMLMPMDGFHPVDTLLQADSALFAVGRIEYCDAFGRSRWTTFQLYADPRVSLNMSQCAVGNDADRC